MLLNGEERDALNEKKHVCIRIVIKISLEWSLWLLLDDVKFVI